MLCSQPEPFVCVSDTVNPSCCCLMKNGGEVAMVQLGKSRKYKSGLQLIGKAKPSVLGLLCFLSAKSVAGYLVSVWQIHHFECLAGLEFEGRLSCLLVIWEGGKAFPDLVRCVCLWIQPAIQTRSSWVNDSLSFIYVIIYLCEYSCLSSVILVQHVQFPVVKMAHDLMYLWTCLIDKIITAPKAFIWLFML